MQKREHKLRSKSHAAVVRSGNARLELARRNTTPLFGLGLVDKISANDIRKAAEEARRKYPGLRGRMAGKFGWRGQSLKLRDFVEAACENEIGLTREELESGETVTSLNLGRELDVAGDITEFIAALPRPRRVLPGRQFDRNMVENGEQIFSTIGCAACHVPKMGGIAEFYSDLLLHDMGPQLADSAAAPDKLPAPTQTFTKGTNGPPVLDDPLKPIPDIARREWKTPPLWGVAVSAPYMHDGRANTLHDAILMHGGEAAGPTNRYRSFDAASRQRVLAFLRTLQGPDPEKLADMLGFSRPSGSTHW